MNNFNISIVEDDKWYAELLKYNLELNPDNVVRCFDSGLSFLKNQKKAPDLICLDYNIPDIEGLELFKKAKEKFKTSEIIIISGQNDVSTAISLLKNGAYDYLVKDSDTNERLWNAIIKIREKENLQTEIKQLRKEVKSKYNFTNLIGESTEIKKISALIEKAGKTNITVSITGETGTGKEVVAKSIHYNSKNKNKPFVAVNVAAIPSELIESELFGHEKGAFTGASNKRIGKFEEANGGTIFLDEIGEMDLNVQTKLLRVLQEKEIVRVGGNSKIPLNSRVIIATHKNLLEEVSNGNFRQDLYYRLLGIPIKIPALRKRDGDIVLLANYFLNNFCAENGMPTKTLSNNAVAKLNAYPFPGNVRELKALMELAVVMSEGNVIQEEDISLRVNGDSLSNLMTQELSLKEYIAKIVQNVLDNNDKNVIKSAKILQIGKSTIYRMMQNKEITI
ncbi:sigma-54-dependent transcriptional regulator [Wenyingzhuangia aestuarii]|uniref:sigma-54-dependent transcriptional regulator n=1 Tax=Wenyingzhuangia aestuarii TaxID=1647582 RepID=UPI00143A1AB1|nr:sigma-54 dependent transcriptional regulator [Wenyingzhuangia aestuarii]NJB82454.1 DNA-binding NtrC family response regulator [Wenyingzhuangia aestuarii]